MERYPDIEIYLARLKLDDLNAWLGEVIDAPSLVPAGKHRWRTKGQQGIPVLLVAQATDGFASLWFDSPDTPWPTDVDCARQAARALGCEVRCSLGGWQPGDEAPDRFLRVDADGQEAEIEWPDSGQ